MDKLFKLTILAKSEAEAEDIAIEENEATHIIKIEEINRVYEVIIIKNNN